MFKRELDRIRMIKGLAEIVMSHYVERVKIRLLSVYK